MKSESTTRTTKIAAASLIAVAAILSSHDAIHAQETATVQAPTAPENESWDAFLPEFIKEGKINIDTRLRWEHADQDSFGGSSNPRESNAFTLRTRLGYTTGSLYNFKAMVEFEDVTIVGNEDNYNQAGLNPGAADRTVIADPEGTEVNRAWLTMCFLHTNDQLMRSKKHIVSQESNHK